MIVCSVPLWWLGSSDVGIELPGNLPSSALMFVVPAFVASYFVIGASGWAGWWHFVRRLGPRVASGTLLWWGVAALTMPIALGAALATHLFGSGASVEALDTTPVSVSLAFAMFLVAAAFEELGWSAYATDVARTYLTDLRAGLVIGAYWAAWHVIPWLQAGHSASWVVAQSAFTVVLRVLLVVVYRNTGRQVSAAVLLHATANIGLIPANGALYDPFLAAAFLAPLVVLALAVKPRLLGSRPSL